MAPLTKDLVEVANPSADAASPQTATSARPASGLRSDALSLEVAVRVHGSRVIEVARGTAPQTEPFEEQTVTMIVFPQGAVLRMSTTVNVSQMLVLTNIKTKQDSICRVLKVRPNANQGSYVEVEFTHRQPGYWGVNFPSEATTSATPSATPQMKSEVQARPPVAAAPPIPVPPVIKPVTPTPVTREAVSVAPPAAPVAPPKPESTFISIGSQESVQDAASATEITRPLSPVERRLQNPGPPVAVPPPTASTASTVATDALTEPLPAPPAPSMEDLLGDTGSSSSGTISVSAEPDSSAAESTAESATSSFAPDFATSHSDASESFGARLDSSFGASPTRDAGSNQNWMLIAASVAVLVAALGAGIVYFRQHPANGAQSAAAAHRAVSASQPVGGSSNQLPAITPTNQPYMPAGSDTNSPSQSNANEAKVNAASVVAPPPNSATEPKTPTSTASRPAPPAKQSAPGVTTSMVSSALTARPTTSTRSDDGQADQAPTLDPAAASNPGALAGFAPANADSLPSPEMKPEGPVKIGGNVKEPKLISSVLPQYPLAARSSGQQGDVVVETTIDKSGSVVRMHVVSGPTSLRSAATDALRRWRYEPSRLDGEPVEVQMLVTIKFRL